MKGSSTQDFLLAVEKLFFDTASKHKGVLSLTIYNDGDEWADVGVFETREDLDAFLEAANTGTNPIPAPKPKPLAF